MRVDGSLRGLSASCRPKASSPPSQGRCRARRAKVNLAQPTRPVCGLTTDRLDDVLVECTVES